MFQNSFCFQFYWTSGFISWILGCCFWILQADLISLNFILFSIVLCLLAGFDIFNLDLIRFSNFGRVKFGSSIYFFVISISVMIMVAFKSLADGLTANVVLLLFVYAWRVYKK
jgi:hypothetical protein